MGFNMSWIFIDGISEDGLYEALDLVPTNGTPERYDLGTSRVPLAGATLKSGWCAIFAKYALVMDLTMGTNPPRLTRLPVKSRCVTCVVLEHAMVSYAGLWTNGRYTWEIRHDPRQGHEDLDLSGDLPQEFERLRDAALEKQRMQIQTPKPQVTGEKELPPEVELLDLRRIILRSLRSAKQGNPSDWANLPVDYVFNVPLDTAATITGYRHNRDVGDDFFRSLRFLQPAEGNVLTKLGLPPKWWQTTGSIKYE
ncbi:MAG: hypothetical protein ACLPX9_11720 [Rhodomicrobium sp.]